MTRDPIHSFSDFWPHYVRAHTKPATRWLHAIGSVSAIAIAAIALAVNLWILIAAPIVGYAFAWYGHFFVEGNRPATFGHPFYSLAADYRMVFLMMAGRMDEEVEHHAGPERFVAMAVSPSRPE